MTFEEFNLHEGILEAISYMGFKEPTEIQKLSIPEVQKGNDLMAFAQTGTGKTAAFLLPILNRIINEELDYTSTLILVPTRELAIQINQEIEAMAYFSGITSLAIFGGGSGDEWGTQKQALTSGTNIIVATPGKLISHLNLGNFTFSDLKFLILDEADRMLDIGFYDDIIKIRRFLPDVVQTLMFSATMPVKIKDLASKLLNNPAELNIAVSKPAEGVLQISYLAYDQNKIQLINSLIKDKEEYNSILIFCSTKKKVNDLVRELKRNNYAAEGISSDLEQDERNNVLLQFKARNVRVLVATDVISRGIDIKDIQVIINYDVPNDAEDYIHRIGRTARAATTGIAITLINPDDFYKFHQIERLLEKEVLKLKTPVEIGDSPDWIPYKPKAKRKFNRKPGHKSLKGSNKKS